MVDKDYSKFDADGVQVHDERGAEIPDPTPMQPPVGYNPQPSLAQQMRQMIIGENLRRAALESGAETFEEADDFEVGDDFEEERSSPYEANFDPMTPGERAALSTQGRDPEKILTQEEQAAILKAAKKTSQRRPGAAPVVESDSDDSDEAEQA